FSEAELAAFARVQAARHRGARKAPLGIERFVERAELIRRGAGNRAEKHVVPTRRGQLAAAEAVATVRHQRPTIGLTRGRLGRGKLSAGLLRGPRTVARIVRTAGHLERVAMMTPVAIIPRRARRVSIERALEVAILLEESEEAVLVKVRDARAVLVGHVDSAIAIIVFAVAAWPQLVPELQRLA